MGSSAVGRKARKTQTAASVEKKAGSRRVSPRKAVEARITKVPKITKGATKKEAGIVKAKVAENLKEPPKSKVVRKITIKEKKKPEPSKEKAITATPKTTASRGRKGATASQKGGPRKTAEKKIEKVDKRKKVTKKGSNKKKTEKRTRAAAVATVQKSVADKSTSSRTTVEKKQPSKKVKAQQKSKTETKKKPAAKPAAKVTKKGKTSKRQPQKVKAAGNAQIQEDKDVRPGEKKVSTPASSPHNTPSKQSSSPPPTSKRSSSPHYSDSDGDEDDGRGNTPDPEHLHEYRRARANRNARRTPQSAASRQSNTMDVEQASSLAAEPPTPSDRASPETRSRANFADFDDGTGLINGNEIRDGHDWLAADFVDEHHDDGALPAAMDAEEHVASMASNTSEHAFSDAIPNIDDLPRTMPTGLLTTQDELNRYAVNSGNGRAFNA